MLNIEYSERFLKDLAKLKRTNAYHKIKKFCFEELPLYEDIRSIRELKKLEGYSEYFRISIGDYRIGLEIEEDNLTVMRVFI